MTRFNLRSLACLWIVVLATCAARLASADSAGSRGGPAEASATRALAGAAVGLVGGVAGFALGFYGTAALPFDIGRDDCVDACGVERLGWALVGGSVVGAVGLSFGSYAGAEWVGGDGSLAYTVLGGLGGSALALAAAIFETRNDTSAPLVAGTVVLLPLAGAVLGYELSSDHRAASAGASVAIGVAPAPGGAGVGVSGRF
jgi:hypothetical protein